MKDFYLEFVHWLDVMADEPAAGFVPNSCLNLKYEVWAHPYNWTDDNINSGLKLAATVDSALSRKKNKYAGTKFRVLKPILITHSMGGFVARAYTNILGNSGKIHGVIHGAMPTHGAPATYKRLLSGFEGGGIFGTAMRWVLGANQREVTASAGNCPGPLELLPNMFHKTVAGSRKWFSVSGKNGSASVSFPNANPYAEIYLNQTNWWRLIYSGYLDPEGDPRGVASFSVYKEQLTKVANYHSKLGANGFHPNTRMLWIGNPSSPAWDHIEWRSKGARDTPSTGLAVNNNNRGRIEWGKWIMPIASGYMPYFAAETRYEI